MGLFKNVASQKAMVFAFDRTDNTPKTGDAGQITGKIRKDFGAAGGITDTNPTEIEDGYYEFDLTQAETNADVLDILPESSTADIQVVGCPARIFTQANGLPDLVLSSGRVDVGQWLGNAVTHGTGGPDVNINAISDDTAAAANLEADYDGSGYAKTASTINTCTTNTDMRGTDSAALASVLGAVGNTAATGDPASDTVISYLKQLVNILIGTDGVASYPAESAPGNAVSLAEVIRAIHSDVTGLNGAAMRGTDSAATASDVNDQVLDVMNTDTLTLPGQEAPPVDPTAFEAITWLYKFLRNKRTQTATTQSLYDDAGTTVDTKATVSDDGTTATREEFVTGP